MWTDKYLDIPFVIGGRDWTGCDCYGLVRLILAEQFGKQIPDYAEGYSELTTDALRPIADAIVGGVPSDVVTCPRAGDVALIALKGYEFHCGVFIDSNTVIHTDRNTGPVIDDIRRSRLFGRVKVVYRVR